MLKPNQIAESYLSVGQAKVSQSPLKTFLLAILAGAFIAFAGVGATFGNVYANKVVGAMIFPGGLAMVILAGSELFTGNCLLIMPLLQGKIKFTDMLKNLVIVYLGNLVGAVLVSAITVFSGAFDAVKDVVIATATSKANLEFFPALLKGVACNILVCLAVWMGMSAETAGGKILAIFFPIAIFVVAGFEHSVANMFYLPAGFFSAIKSGADLGTLTVVNSLVNNLLPVTIGNIVGGMAVGAIYKAIYLPKKSDENKA
ncbi:MAG: formate/nitrite transporter family protein [Clostridia bacterium]|nr:formate/nitrite transporter family protein [Clostridia bacterium]